MEAHGVLGGQEDLLGLDPELRGMQVHTRARLEDHAVEQPAPHEGTDDEKERDNNESDESANRAHAGERSKREEFATSERPGRPG